jgi:hypothetical protein
MRRALVRCLVGCLAVGASAGCSPAVRGMTGVRLDAEGRLVAVVGWCPGSGDTAIVVLFTSDKGDIAETVVTVKNDGGGAAGNYAEITIADPEQGWRADTHPVDLDETQPYIFRAWNRDGDRATNFPFRLDELRRQSDRGRPILVKEKVAADRYESTFQSPEEFQDASGSEC